MLIGTIEIVMRKIDASGSTSETVLVSLQGVESQEVTLSSDILTFPSLEIRINEQTVYHNNQLVSLTHHEFFTLLYLTRHPGWVFSREQIYEAVWKENSDGGAAVTNVVSQIRKKIGDRYIKTVIGSGYKFEA